MENDNYSIYPQKPFLEKEPPRKGHLALTIFSLSLFAFSLTFFFENQLTVLFEIVGVVLFHELGHYVMMKLFGYSNVRMLFLPFMGAFVHGHKEEYIQSQSVLVVLAGPMPGIIAGVLFWIVGFEYQIQWMVETSLFLFVINIINLIPILPLDGGRLLNILFLERIEILQVIFTFASSLILIFVGWFMGWTLVMIFGFLMGFQVRSLHRKYLIHKGLKQDEVDFNSTYDNLSDRAYYYIKNHVLENTPGLRRLVDQVDEEETKTVVASEVSNVLIPPMDKNIKLGLKILVVFAWLASIVVPIYLIVSSPIMN